MYYSTVEDTHSIYFDHIMEAILESYFIGLKGRKFNPACELIIVMSIILSYIWVLDTYVYLYV